MIVKAVLAGALVIGQVPRKHRLRWSLGYKIFIRDIRDQHL